MQATPYINLARKYRPVNLADIQGQEITTKIINRAILTQRLAPGYLFTGIRGVGKTTFARIIAKTINCSKPVVDIEQIKPCGECNNCVSIQLEKHPDIIEIDAASRTSVSDIREVIQSSEYKPLIGKYKVFIIDEVHMLSKSAFNALLKILEEPPPYIIFIFATTEVQKIPITVISRCQRHDLKRLSIAQILQILKNITKQEQLNFADEALSLIAVKADGSARDAISMLDQLANLVDNEQQFNASFVTKVFGGIDPKVIIEFCQYVIAANAKHAIDLLGKLYNNSQDLVILIIEVSDFIAYLTKRMMISDYSYPVYDTFTTQINDIIKSTNITRLSVLWQIFNQSLENLKTAHNQLVAVEMLVIKAIYFQTLPEEGIQDAPVLNSSDNQVRALQQNIEKNQHIDNNLEPLRDEQLAQSFSHNVVQEVKKITDIQPSLNNQLLEKIILQKLYKFLQYLHSKNERSIYYLLLNQVQIEQFANNTMVIAVNSSLDSQVTQQIISLLFDWSGEKWQISFKNTTNLTSLKKVLMKNVQNSAEYKLIEDIFNESSIEDIFLKT